MAEKERMEELRKELKKASEDYYNGTESMSNFEYDAKFDELKELEGKYGKEGENFTDTVGAEVEASGALPKVHHEFEAKSLGKTKQVSELIKEQSKTEDGKNGYTCLSWKLDGCTCQLTYDNGELILAATRGDGLVGQNITKNAGYIEGIPGTIPFKGRLTVRGEALMSYTEFDRLNTDGQYANPRNLASATITALDAELLTQRHINFKAFELVNIDAKGMDISGSFTERLDWLRSQGFDVVDHEKVQLSDLERHISRWSEPANINALGFPVDGLVAVFDDTQKTEKLAGTGHHPSLTKAMAFKWQDEAMETVLRRIEWSPSRTGLLNPVAVFDTIDLCGTKVSRASLHNVSYIEGLNLKVGDRITVYKANMIIPQVAENLDRNKEQIHIHGVECPCCKEEAVVKDNNGTLTMVCENEACLAKELGMFTHFVEKAGMNIDGLSEKTLLTLMENGIITELSDLFKLNEDDREAYVAIEGCGDTSFKKMLYSIKQAAKTDTEHFLYACGIEGISKGQIREIKKFLENNYDGCLSKYQVEDGSYDLIGLLTNMQMDHFDFTQIDGIGEILAKNLSDFIEKELVEPYYGTGEGKGYAACLAYLTFTDKPVERSFFKPFAGKNFVITGALNAFRNRDDAIKCIESYGGKVSGAISKSTDYLINNDINSVSGKNKKAKELGIPIITEEQLARAMGEGFDFLNDEEEDKEL